MFAIKCTNINKSYKNRRVLKDFNLEIKENEMVALMGKSGVGKSTILSIIGLIEKKDSGKIEFFGNLSPKINSKANIILLRETVSFLFQNNALIEDESIKENLDIVLYYKKIGKKEKEALMKKALSSVGLDYSLNKKIYELSGGEQQRVAIAKLILKDSKIILADEPTGSLDSDNAKNIIALLKDLRAKGKTILIVTHDNLVAESCDRIIKIENS